MAVNFGLLQQAAPVSAFFQGQQDIRAEQDRNALRQQQAQQLAMQQENALALRESRMALAEERRAAAAKAAESQGWLSKVTALFESNNMPLNLQTARQGQLYAIRSGNKEAVEMMNKTVQALEEREALTTAFGPQAAAPGAAPAVAPAVAPANALAAPPQAPTAAPALAAGGVSREQLQAIIANPNAPKAVVDRAKVLLDTLPKQPTPRAPQLLTPEEEAQRIRIARESRPPREPKEPAAPTVTQIQDPTNPDQMLTVDARRYAGGGVGSPGVIGTSGKTPKAADARIKQEQGASQAQDILDTLKTAYGELDRMRAVPSEQRNAISNILSGIAATGVGQAAGRMTGTAAQTQRDIIASARNQLLMSVARATGLSASQLNSNVEFRTWLDSLTDPSRSIQANQTILENVERFIASGGKYSARKGEGQVKPTAPAGDLAAERQNARAAIAAGAPEAAVRQRFKEKTGQEL